MTKKLIYIKIDISCREGSIPSCRYIKAQTENNAPLGAPAGVSRFWSIDLKKFDGGLTSKSDLKSPVPCLLCFL